MTALHGFAHVDVALDPAPLPTPRSAILVNLLDGSRRLATRAVVALALGSLWLVASDGTR